MQRRQEEPVETTLKSEDDGERGEQQRGMRTEMGRDDKRRIE